MIIMSLLLIIDPCMLARLSAVPLPDTDDDGHNVVLLVCVHAIVVRGVVFPCSLLGCMIVLLDTVSLYARLASHI